MALSPCSSLQRCSKNVAVAGVVVVSSQLKSHCQSVGAQSSLAGAAALLMVFSVWPVFLQGRLSGCGRVRGICFQFPSHC